MYIVMMQASYPGAIAWRLLEASLQALHKQASARLQHYSSPVKEHIHDSHN